MEKTSWREYWVYNELRKNYKVVVTKDKVEIRFRDDNQVYARFDIKEIKLYDEYTDCCYLVYDNGTLIVEELEFIDTYDDIVLSCLYYFWSRY